MKLSCIGDLISVRDWCFVTSVVDFVSLSEDTAKVAAALMRLGAPTASSLDLIATEDAFLFGGGDMDLSLDDWNAS